ncbi:hypothetical protein [Streptomyces sp. A1277]|uniref:hypothetical protein n=1 Tax=Streptomyces sp. A1277 TaxID=2563103 RepID=UPI001F106576|nr:hypothetical protein [Streptomyces sp. A1277]
MLPGIRGLRLAVTEVRAKFKYDDHKPVGQRTNTARRDVLGFKVLSDVGEGKARWITSPLGAEPRKARKAARPVRNQEAPVAARPYGDVPGPGGCGSPTGLTSVPTGHVHLYRSRSTT